MSRFGCSTSTTSAGCCRWPTASRRWRTRLRSLARGELYNPLRLVVRPPGEPSLMGLMPAHRGGDAPSAVAEGVCDRPGQRRARARHPPGLRGALRRRDRRAARAASTPAAITAIRTAAVSGVATRLLARDDVADARDPRLRARRRGPTSTRCGQCARSSASSSGAATPGASSSTASRRRPTAEEAVRGADVVVHGDLGREPIVAREWLSRARTSTRSARASRRRASSTRRRWRTRRSSSTGASRR